MKKHYSLKTGFLAAMVLFAVSIGANAAPSWVFTDSGVDTSSPTNNIATTHYNNSTTGNAGTTLDISGAYAANNSGNTGFATSTTKWNTTTSNSGQSATLVIYGGGLGMNSDGNTSPNHAIDNLGNTEAVLLSFGNSVKLTSIGFGYATDSDVSLFRYVGTSTPPANLNTVGASLTSMTSAGWSLVGNYSDVGTDTTNPYYAVNAGNSSSSWWLISAYNPAYGQNWSTGNDAFKIFAVAANCTYTNSNGTCGSGNTPGTGVPEPGSLALVALGLLGVAGMRRRTGGKTV